MRRVREGAAWCAVVAFAAIVALGAWATAAVANTWPSRPIRVIFASPPGSAIDSMLRTMQEALAADLGQPIILENRPGADQVLAARQVAAAAPDGYTLLVGTGTQFAVNPVTRAADLGYDADRDFAPITLIGYQTMLVVIDPALPVRTLAELAAYSRAHPDKLNYGASMGSLTLAGESLKAAISADLTHIPYNGIARTMNALIAGDVQVAIVDVAIALPQLNAGRARALVVSGAARFPALPDVPTFAQAGYPNVDMPIWSALFAPAGTPEAIIVRLREAFVRALEKPEIREKFIGVGNVPSPTTPDGLRTMIQRERAAMAVLARRLGMVGK